MAQRIPIQFQSSTGLIFKDGIHASLESFTVSEANPLDNNKFKVKGTFVVYRAYDGTNIEYGRYTYQYVAILSKILDEYEVIKIIYGASPTGYWHCLYPVTTENCYPENISN